MNERTRAEVARLLVARGATRRATGDELATPARRPEVEGPPPVWRAPDPIGRDAARLPFPTRLLPSWMRDFVEALAQSMQVPVDMPACFALGALAGVVGGHVRARAWGDFEDACNLYLVVAMPPASGKSPVHRQVVAPILAAEEDLRQTHGPRVRDAQILREVAEKRKKRAMDQAAKADGPARDEAIAAAQDAQIELDRLASISLPRLIVDDTTPEQLLTIMARGSGRLAMLSAESSLFGIIAGQRYSSAPNLEAVLAAHSGDPIRIDRREREEVIPDPRLSICIAVQPEVLREAYKNRVARERGLFARFLYCFPPSNVGDRDLLTRPPSVPDGVRQGWHRRIRGIAHAMHQTSEPIVLQLSSEAEATFGAFRACIEPRRKEGGDLVSMLAWAGKLDGTVLRIAGLLHVAEPDGPDITQATMVRAVDLMGYFIAHAQLAHDEMGEDDDARDMRRVLRWVAKRGEAQFTRTDCYRAFKGRLTADELTPVLANLDRAAYLRRRTIGTGRQATEVYDVNPLVFDESMGLVG